MFLFNHSKQNDDNYFYYKGILFEHLLQQYLHASGFKVELRRKKNSLEYDIEGTNNTTGQHVLGEAKAQEKSITAKDFTSFVGKLLPFNLAGGNVHGLFLSSSALTPEAEDYYGKVKTRYGITSKTGRELFEAIESALKLPSFNVLSNLLKEKGYISLTSNILTTDNGIFIVVISRAHNSGTPAYFTIFDSFGHAINDKPFIEVINNSDKSIQPLEPILLDKKKNLISKKEPERCIPKGLSLGVDWSDYRLPASPQYFIGRKTFVDRIFKHLNENQKPNVLQIKSRSGVGKSSVLAYIDSLCTALGAETELHDSRDIKSTLDVYSVVQRFTKSTSLAHDSRDIEKQLHTFSEANKGSLKLFFVDQFESTFHIPDVFEAYESLSDTFSRIRNGIYIIFARKNDQLTTFDDSLISLEKLNSISKPFELPDFSKDEAISLLTSISRSYGNKPIARDVRSYVLEFAQGFPWLIKRTMAHLIHLLNKGVTQSELVATGLRLDDLFDEELEGLDEIERDYITRIASRLPADYHQLQIQFDEDPLLPKLLDKLTRSRLLRLTGSTYDTYNDVFKEYLIYKKIPDLRQFNIYRMYPTPILSAFHKFVDKEKFTSKEFKTIQNQSLGSAFNILRELRNLNLIKAEKDNWKIPQSIKDIYNKGRLGEYIRRQLLENEIISRLVNIVTQENKFHINNLTDYLREHFPFIEASPKTWTTYAAILRSWVVETKLLELNRKSELIPPSGSRIAIIENLGNMEFANTPVRRQPLNFFLPNCSNFSSVENALYSIQNGVPIDKIKNRTILTDLRNGGWLKEEKSVFSDLNQFRDAVKKELQKKPLSEIWEAVKDNKPILPVFEQIVDGRYTEETLKWRLKLLIRWAKYLNIIPQKRVLIKYKEPKYIGNNKSYRNNVITIQHFPYNQIKKYIQEHFPKTKGITRIDIAKSNTHGWEVRIRRMGQSINEFFSDQMYGGIKSAYDFAKDRKNEIEKTLKPYSRREISSRMSKRNTSGIVGVRKGTKVTKRDGKEWIHEVWIAHGSPKPGVHKNKSFYINKYGEEGAKAKAIEQRKKWETEMDLYDNAGETESSNTND